LTYFELDELINDYEVTTVSGLIIASHIPKQGEKLIWQNLN
jgi:putative hemolysin